MQINYKHRLMSMLLAAVLVMLGSMLGFWLYGQFALKLNLVDQKGWMQLPEHIDANVAATNTFAIKMDGDVSFQAPIKQDMNIVLQGNYPANIKLDTNIPIQFDLNYQGMVEIDSYTDVETTTAIVAPYLPKLPLTIRIPLKFNVPLNLNLPVKTNLRFVYDGPVRIGLNQNLNLPIDMIIDSKIPIDREVNVPLLTSFNVQIQTDSKPVPVILNSKINIPFRHLGFEQQKNQQPH